jgi:zinc and cadmium transporter
MSVIFYILLFCFLSSLISLAGLLIFYFKSKFLDKILLFLVSFACGALLGGAFFHLLAEAIPQAIERGFSLTIVFIFLLLGFCSLYVMEDFIKWHHHHSAVHKEIKSFSYLILLSDTLHNFLDGVIIAVAFLTNLQVGVAVSLAVMSHEIPQEIGDFAVLIFGGVKKKKALLFNFISGLFALLGGIAGFLFLAKINNALIFLLPFAAGNFIYIACSDLIPHIKEKTNLKSGLFNFSLFILGIVFMIAIKFFFE